MRTTSCENWRERAHAAMTVNVPSQLAGAARLLSCDMCMMCTVVARCMMCTATKVFAHRHVVEPMAYAASSERASAGALCSIARLRGRALTGTCNVEDGLAATTVQMQAAAAERQMCGDRWWQAACAGTCATPGQRLGGSKRQRFHALNTRQAFRHRPHARLCATAERS